MVPRDLFRESTPQAMPNQTAAVALSIPKSTYNFPTGDFVKIIFAIVLILTCSVLSQSGLSQAKPQSLDQLADRYFDESFKFNPTAGTAAGFHQYDTQLEDYSRATIDKQIAMLKGFQKQFAA